MALVARIRGQSAFKLGAREVFWDLPEIYVDKLRELMLLPAANSFVDILKSLALHALGPLPDEELFEICSKRAFERKVVVSTEWMQEGQVLDELDKGDLSDVKDFRRPHTIMVFT